MTRDDIIRMAREAGSQHQGELFVPDAFALRFAALVAAHEREECAKACDELEESARAEYDKYLPKKTAYLDARAIAAEECAAAIRARGEKR